nr:U3 small nucleolar ribonucleoprotein IMP4 [Paratrimastix eleionoma]
MDRRTTRLRREYLQTKTMEGRERLMSDRKRRIREAQEDGRPIPTELRFEEADLRRRNTLDDAVTRENVTNIDDEYANAGMQDPKIVITSSRDPSSRLIQFVKELHLLFPNAQRLNRGTHVIDELVTACRSNGVTDVILAHEHRGEPDGLIISHLPYGPTAYFGLVNPVLRHDIGPMHWREKPQENGEMSSGLSMNPYADRNRKQEEAANEEPAIPTTISQQFPHLIFHNFKTPLGERVRNILKFLFPVPKAESTRVITFANENDFISFRHHTFQKEGGKVVLSEVGPRFELRLYQIKLGTAEMKDADTEWILRPYMRSAKKAIQL